MQHTIQLRVYYEDTDCGNVVYYANYLKYMERSRTELLREKGIDLAEYHEKGLLFAVTEAHVFYKAPARYNDLLDLQSTIAEITPVTMLFTTIIRRTGNDILLVKGDIRLACISPEGKPRRIPDTLRNLLPG